MHILLQIGHGDGMGDSLAQMQIALSVLTPQLVCKVDQRVRCSKIVEGCDKLLKVLLLIHNIGSGDDVWCGQQRGDIIPPAMADDLDDTVCRQHLPT